MEYEVLELIDTLKIREDEIYRSSMKKGDNLDAVYYEVRKPSYNHSLIFSIEKSNI